MKSKPALLCAGIIVAMTGVAEACGPFFDDAYLVRGSEEEFLSMPDGSFQYEIEKISGKKKAPPMEEKDTAYYALRDKTAKADIDDLKDALGSSPAPAWQKEEALRTYQENRSEITEYLKNSMPADPWRWYGDQFRSEEKRLIKEKIIKERGSPYDPLIPEEFRLYTDAQLHITTTTFGRR